MGCVWLLYVYFYSLKKSGSNPFRIVVEEAIEGGGGNFVVPGQFVVVVVVVVVGF